MLAASFVPKSFRPRQYVRTLRWADLIVCRAGAITPQKSRRRTRRSFYSVWPRNDSHQLRNAQEMVNATREGSSRSHNSLPGALASEIFSLLDHSGEVELLVHGRVRSQNQNAAHDIVDLVERC